MSRSFESIRMGVKDVSRWLKASRALKKEDLRAEAGRDGKETL